jgi:hypothetical protein
MEIRYAILASEETVCQAHWRSVEQLQALGGVACAAIIQAGEQPALPFRAGSAAGCRPVDLRAQLPALRRVDVASASELSLDFILNCTFLSPGRPLIEAAAHGVWMFFYGNPTREGAWPPAWGEIDRGELLTHITLSRLSDPAVVLGECVIPTDRTSYRTNLQNALIAGIDLPANALKNLRAGRAQCVSLPAELPPSRVQLSFVRKARFLAGMARSWAVVQIRSMFVSEDWNVGIVEAPIARFLDPAFRPDVTWLPRYHGRARFIADPFAVPSNNGLTVLVEEFDNNRYQGFLSSIDWAPGTAVPPARVMIDEGIHMSYPFPVKHGGELFLMPETQVRREVALYRRDSTGVWRRAHQLISDFAALDATAVRFDGRWWLFCGSQDELPECKLYVFYSDDLFGPWIPHPMNPVKCDARSSRPGGTPFEVDGKLYRPAQDASHGYGGALTINLVKILTPEEFEEEAVCSIGPIAGSLYNDGLHTLSTAGGGRTLIDGKRLVFTPERIPRRVLHKLRRLGQVLFR